MFDPVERIRIDITEDGRVDLTGNTSRMFPNGLDWVRASDYDALLKLYREAVGRLARFGHGNPLEPPKPKDCTCDWHYDWTTRTDYHEANCPHLGQ